MKVKKFREDVYLSKVTAIHATHEELEKWLKINKVSLGDYSHFEGMHFLDSNDDNVIWLEKSNAFYSLLHECVHLVRSIFERRGITCNLANEDEHFAYYQNYWFKQLWRFFGNIKKKDSSWK